MIFYICYKKLEMKTHTFFLLTALLIATGIYGQNGNSQNRGSTRQLTKWEKMFGEVKYGDNIYKKGSNWLSLGFGSSYHIENKDFNQSISLAYHHRYKAVFFNAGWHFSSPQFFQYKPLKIVRSMEILNDFHVGAGLRFEDKWYHIGFFIGPSFATTWLPKENDSKVSVVNNQLGAHVELQLTFKYLYDLGIGTSLYGSFNKRYQVAGIQLQFYFSNAFVTKY